MVLALPLQLTDPLAESKLPAVRRISSATGRLLMRGSETDRRVLARRDWIADLRERRVGNPDPSARREAPLDSQSLDIGAVRFQYRDDVHHGPPGGPELEGRLV